MSTTRVSAERGELDILTSLRFVAALGVVIHHVGVDSSRIPGWANYFVRGIHEHGGKGVQFFFTLSGFILAYVYSTGGGVRWRPFLVARFARIMPVYLFALVVGLPMLTSKVGQHIDHHGLELGMAVAVVKAISVLMLVQAWLPSFALFWNGVSWSLSAEAFFYGCFPPILKRLRSWSNVGLVGLLAGLLVFEVVRFLADRLQGGLMFDFMPIVRIHEFVSGMVICLLHLRGYAPGRVLGAVSGGVLVTCLIVPSSSIGWEILRTVGTHVTFCLLIVALARVRPSDIPPRFWVRPFLFLGHISYAVYLLHFPLLTIWERLGFPAYKSPLWFLMSLLLMSALTFLWIEEPARRWIRRRWAGKGA